MILQYYSALWHNRVGDIFSTNRFRCNDYHGYRFVGSRLILKLQ